MCVSHPTQANPKVATEEKLLAAFSINLARFTSWKNRPKLSEKFSKIQIGVHANPKLLTELQKLSEGKKIGDHSIEVISLTSEEIVSKSTEIIILIPENGASPLANLKRIKGCQCLSVTRHQGMAEAGAVINFYREDDHLRFEVNSQRGKEEELELSSQILRLGKVPK